jgi:hypothetical protein
MYLRYKQGPEFAGPFVLCVKTLLRFARAI